jgi:phenylalanyl-tRNA synthetase beta chain
VRTAEIARILAAHQIIAPREPLPDGTFPCLIPAHRPDLEREIDLIEEIARTAGLDAIPVHDKIAVRPAPPQARERAMHELGAALTALGFYETVTFTFITPAEARPFVEDGESGSTLRVSTDRRTHDPVLRPSVIPSLLKCRKANQDGGVAAEGGVRLFEVASVFGSSSGSPSSDERRMLTLLADAAAMPGAGGAGKAAEQVQATFRLLRAAIESVTASLGGSGNGRAKIGLRPTASHPAAFEKGAAADVLLGEARTPIGIIAQVSRAVQSQFGLESSVCAAELDLGAVLALYPPRATASALPAFPSIERDVSLIVPEATAWADVEGLVRGQVPPLALMESVRFITTYRGKPIEAGRKSVTLRLKFRDPARTLRHEEVDPQMQQLIAAARSVLGAEVRAV